MEKARGSREWTNVDVYLAFSDALAWSSLGLGVVARSIRCVVRSHSYGLELRPKATRLKFFFHCSDTTTLPASSDYLSAYARRFKGSEGIRMCWNMARFSLPSGRICRISSYYQCF
jgi:hypothetical protein